MATKGKRYPNGMDTLWVIVAFYLSIVLLIGVMTYTGVRDRPEISLPILCIAGVIALISVLAMIAKVLGALNLTDRTQALGLPEGSVRAMIALSLVVIFVIVSVFLYANLTKETVSTVGNITQAQLDAIPADQIVSSTERDDGRFDVILRTEQSDAARNVATQTISIVGTLVTAVAAFYFGSKSVAQAKEETASLTITYPVVDADGKVSLKRGKDEKLSIKVDVKPADESLGWGILSGDSDGKLIQIKPNEFEYEQSSQAANEVTLKLWLVNYPDVSKTLKVQIPEATK